MALKYPTLGFHFGVEISGITPEGKYLGFREVSGINQSIGNGKTWKEGGENRFTHRLPEPPTYSDLTLKRAIRQSTFPGAFSTGPVWDEAGMYEWFRSGLDGNLSGIAPQTVTVRLLDQDHNPIHAWDFIHAWPKDWKVSDLNATNSEIVIETITFSYQYFRKAKLPQTPAFLPTLINSLF